jgi:hypothetical protein
MQKFRAKHLQSGGQPILLESIPSLHDSDWACCISIDWRGLCRSSADRFFFSDGLGRRFTILIGGNFFCLGGGLQTGAANYGYVMAGRFIAGIG